MNFSQFILNTNTLLGLGVVVFSVTYAVTNWRNAKFQANRDLIEALTKQIEAQREVIKDLQGQINKLNQDVGALKGINDANEKKIKDYMDILANRSPEFENRLIALTNNSTNAAEFILDAQVFIKQVREALKIA